jgi:MSHA biogenesis protein MshQ
MPSGDDYPFMAKVRQSFPAASLQETDQGQVVCYATGTDCLGYSYDFSDDPGSEVRLGRLWIGNAHGSELSGLSLPVRLESWQSTAGGSFQPEGLDTCSTASVLGAPFLDDYSGGLADGETAASLSWPIAMNDRSVSLSAPGSGNAGSVAVSLPDAPAWLQYPWNGTNRSAAKGLASFGIYKGATPLIFRRELYR